MQKQKTVFLTGANGDIGRQLLKKFSKSGFKIICAISNKKKNKNLISFYKKQKNIKFIELDLSKKNEEIEKVIQKNLQNISKIDYAILNAGSIFNDLILTTRHSKLREIFQINYFSNVVIIQQIFKKITHYSGNILFISSTSAEDCPIGRFAYSGTKAAMNSLIKTSAKEFGRYGIRVNGIMPGLINTKMMNNFTSKDNINNYIKNNSLKKIAETLDIYNLVKFLISKNASHINGEIIRVDGCHIN